MLAVSEKASEELHKFFNSDKGRGNHLIIYFQGMACSGPALGLAVDTKVDELEKIEEAGIEAYMDPKLREFLSQFEGVNIDYVTMNGQSGFTIKVAGADGCASCGDKTEHCD
ncbi:hypothetical protein GF420_13570 [candidate division GN15 bacterium]|nr:hypothetical protein [candidate division GN15 bacterium]